MGVEHVLFSSVMYINIYRHTVNMQFYNFVNELQTGKLSQCTYFKETR